MDENNEYDFEENSNQSNALVSLDLGDQSKKPRTSDICQSIDAKNETVLIQDTTSKQADHKEQLKLVTNKDVPDGGYGWVVVFGCFLSHIIIGGFERIDGIYYLKFKSRYDKSAQLTAWPSALVSTIRLFLGPLASALTNIYSVRMTVLIGAILMTTGLILTAFTPNFYFLFFSQSLLQGVGCGLMYGPSIVIVGLYFDKHRGLAAGLGSAGVGVGTFCIVPLTQWLFDFYGFQGAFFILAGIAFNGLLVGMLFRPLSLHNKWNRLNWLKGKKSSDEDMDLMKHNSVCNENNEMKSSDITPTKPLALSKQHTIRKCSFFYSSLKICCPIEKKRTGDGTHKKDILNLSLLKNPSFVMFCISVMFFTAAFKAAFTFIPALVKSQDISESDAALVLSITGVFDTAGRIVAGFIFDLKRIKLLRLSIYNALIFAIAGVSFILPSLTTFYSFVTLCSVYGILTGAYISQKSVVIVDILGVESLAASFGLLICFQAVGMCAGPILSGVFFDIFGSFTEAFYLGGGFMVAAGFLMVISNVLLRFSRKKHFFETETEVTKSDL